MLRLALVCCLVATPALCAATEPAVKKAIVDSNGSVHIFLEDGSEQTIKRGTALSVESDRL